MTQKRKKRTLRKKTRMIKRRGGSNAVTQDATNQPANPIINQPVANQTANQPVANQPVANQPVANQPVANANSPSIRNSAVVNAMNQSNIIGTGESKTVFKINDVDGTPYVIIAATKNQMNGSIKITKEQQKQEYEFSKKLNEKFPNFFPKVYSLEDDNAVIKQVVAELNSAEHTEKYKKNNTSEYIWVKEACNPPEYEEICSEYLYKVIQLLVNLMKVGLCYIDVKPMNIGKRGNDYVVIDTGRQDIYFIPEEYQLDYLKSELLICCMSLYGHLKATPEKSHLNQVAFQQIKNVLSFLLVNNYLTAKKDKNLFISNLEEFIKSNIFITDKGIEKYTRSLIIELKNKMSRDENQRSQILSYQKDIPCKETKCDDDEIALIRARFDAYIPNGKIEDFFRNLEVKPMNSVKPINAVKPTNTVQTNPVPAPKSMFSFGKFFGPKN